MHAFSTNLMDISAQKSGAYPHCTRISKLMQASLKAKEACFLSILSFTLNPFSQPKEKTIGAPPCNERIKGLCTPRRASGPTLAPTLSTLRSSHAAAGVVPASRPALPRPGPRLRASLHISQIKDPPEAASLRRTIHRRRPAAPAAVRLAPTLSTLRSSHAAAGVVPASLPALPRPGPRLLAPLVLLPVALRASPPLLVGRTFAGPAPFVPPSWRHSECQRARSVAPSSRRRLRSLRRGPHLEGRPLWPADCQRGRARATLPPPLSLRLQGSPALRAGCPARACGLRGRAPVRPGPSGPPRSPRLRLAWGIPAPDLASVPGPLVLARALQSAAIMRAISGGPPDARGPSSVAAAAAARPSGPSRLRASLLSALRRLVPCAASPPAPQHLAGCLRGLRGRLPGPAPLPFGGLRRASLRSAAVPALGRSWLLLPFVLPLLARLGFLLFRPLPRGLFACRPLVRCVCGPLASGPSRLGPPPVVPGALVAALPSFVPSPPG